MKIFKVLAASLVLAVCACANQAPPPKPAQKPQTTKRPAAFAGVKTASISYFKGNALITSSDGRIIYGLPKIALMRRAVVPRDNRIVEEVISEVGSYILVITGKPPARVFVATTPSGKKIAHVEFEGHPYAANRWKYLSFDEPPKTLITARRSMESLKMTSTSLAAKNEEQRLTTWELTEVSRDKYQQLRADLIEEGIFRNETPEWDLP